MDETPALLTHILPLPASTSLSQVYASLNLHRPLTVVLDSSVEPSPGGAMRLARYCFIAQEPFGVLEAYPDCVLWHDVGGTERLQGDPLEVLQRFLRRYPLSDTDAPTPLPAGALGYLGYGLKATIEPCPNRLPAPNRLPLFWLGFYDAIATVDLEQRQVVLTSSGLPDMGARACRRAQQKLQRLVARWERALATAPIEPAWTVSCGEAEPLWSRADYLRAVHRAKEYIAAGDIYQVNLAQAYQADFHGDVVSLFLTIRDVSPAPFGAFIQAGDFTVISASPERFLHVCSRTRIVQTRPIKGTCPRSRAPHEDQRLARELLHSPKDRAEHLMIVDLERNDLGRVATFGSVRVLEMMTLEGYRQVYHLTSTVQAQLRDHVDVGTLLRATFPGGSITGAPKVRAMQIIEELEPVAREVYTGSIGYIGFHGGLDLNIAIRTAVLRGCRLTVYGGGGIVADSEPEEEYEEIQAKLAGWFQAISAGGKAHAVGMVER